MVDMFYPSLSPSLWTSFLVFAMCRASPRAPQMVTKISHMYSPNTFN